MCNSWGGTEALDFLTELLLNDFETDAVGRATMKQTEYQLGKSKSMLSYFDQIGTDFDCGRCVASDGKYFRCRAACIGLGVSEIFNDNSSQAAYVICS